MKIYINKDWQFSKLGEKPVKITLPHTNAETPLHHFDDKIYQFESEYIKSFAAKESWAGKKVLLTFEGVAHVAKVYVNEKIAGEHKGGYTAFTFDISPFLNFGEENTLKVQVDSRETCNIPPFGNVVDYLTYGGIYREAYLEIKNQSNIKDIFVSGSGDDITCQLEIDNFANGMSAHCDFKKVSEKDWSQLCKKPVEGSKITIKEKIANTEKWDIQSPVMYQLKVCLKNGEETLDEKIVNFGLRDVRFKKDGIYLNGEKIKLRGLNRHQSYPYVGYAMPKRPQQLDADILKFELGCNAVRTSHYPQSQYFLNRCDEIGLLVFTELPGWQHIGDSDWKNSAVEMASEMVLQNRNHPSIILWGARINESQDDDEFYHRTNAVIRSLDPTRQTGGVRFIKNSNLIEDVYTYNDFSHTGGNAGLEKKSKVTKTADAPYLVSEYNGHMFPTKPFDCETHRQSHAKRHANVLESMYSQCDTAGCFGWCMFDYNTHKDFGSGDRICYHGVMNAFRIPKLAASVYKSQSNAVHVLEISSSMDIGEHAGGNIEEVYAYTNADYVKLYKNNEFVKDFYPNKKEFGNMPHPPILIDDFIGELMEKHEKYSHKNAEAIKSVLRAIVKYGQNSLPLKYKLRMAKVMVLEKLTMEDGMRLYYNYVGNWGGEATTYRFDAVKGGKVVKSCEKSASNKVSLEVLQDTATLCCGESYDVSTVRVKVINQHGEMLPYYQGVINFEISGSAEIVGEKSVCGIGGGVATYVKTVGETGSATLKISASGALPAFVNFKIV